MGRRSLAGALLLCVALCSPSKAALTFTVNEVGSNVVAAGSGTLNLAALTGGFTQTAGGLVWPSFPTGGLLIVGAQPGVTVDGFSGISGLSPFGSGPRVLASSGTGDVFGFIAGDLLYVKAGYVQGSALSGTATFQSQTLASLGLAPGTYLYTWGSGQTADSITLTIGNVPEPSSMALAAVGLGVLVMRRRLAARSQAAPS